MGETQKSPFGLASYLRKILRGLYVSPMFFDKVVMVDPVWWQLKLFQIQKSWNSGILGSFSRIFVEMFHAAKHSNLDRQKWNMINHPFLHSGVPSWNHICFPAFPPKSLPIKERIKAYRCLMMIFASSHGASFWKHLHHRLRKRWCQQGSLYYQPKQCICCKGNPSKLS